MGPVGAFPLEERSFFFHTDKGFWRLHLTRESAISPAIRATARRERPNEPASYRVGACSP